MNKTRELYRVDQLPIFQQRMYATEQEARACPRGDVQLVEDLETGLIYNIAFRYELMEYDEHYQNEQAVSPLFMKHLDTVAHIIEHSLGSRTIIEVGCGKGIFLEMLLAKGFDIMGCDPTYQGTNPKVIKQYFTPSLGIKADGIILRHVLEHIQDPVSFLMMLKEANGGAGKIYIEVPDLDWICQNQAWFDVYYEHVNYFRLSDFYRMFDTVYEGGRLFGEQYLYVVAELSSIRKPEYVSSNPVDFPSDFLLTLECEKEKKEYAAIWGGASKGVIFALLKERAGSPVDMVIDINPAKQGKYLPATGLKVLSPREALSILSDGATIFVMNSQYLNEIREMSDDAFNYIEVPQNYTK